MTSKIIQILRWNSDYQNLLVALCEDGTIWKRGWADLNLETKQYEYPWTEITIHESLH